ncbi:MAG: toxin-antitoxin system HicB family antitoxin [Alphaproteobacteria bacterium]
MSRPKTRSLHLPRSLEKEVERLSREDGTSVNQFVAVAVAEKVSALRTASFFADRRQKADPAAFARIIARQGGEPPREGDEVPDVPR